MTTSVAQCTFCGCRAPEAADDLSASPRCFGCGRSLQSGGGGDAVLDSLPSSTTFDTRCEIFTVADLNM
ncbi:MAG: hypothetical protein JXR77_15165, partial [Lentisphaeria bacterium]|nr:hypothetical protein [Lentisphaeria bacterium]